MTDTTQLKAMLRQSGYKLHHVATVVGVCDNTLRRKLNGTSEFKLAEAERLASLLEMDEAKRTECFFGALPEQGGDDADD